MNRQAQSFLLAFLGAFVVRLGWTDEHLLYVRGWTRWPLIGAGLVLLALAAGLVVAQLRDSGPGGAGTEQPAPRTAWLLFVPLLVVMLVSPPALGSYYAERSASTTYRDPGTAASELRPLPEGDPVRLAVTDFFVRARYDEGRSLAGRRLELTGFVSRDDRDRWYVTRFAIACCAADAVAVRVRVDGSATAPDRDSWVRVVGTWVDERSPVIAAESVEAVAMPRNPYE